MDERTWVVEQRIPVLVLGAGRSCINSLVLIFLKARLGYVRYYNSLVSSASPLNGKLENIHRLEDAGAATVVLASIFGEQIETEMLRHEALTAVGLENLPEARS